MTQHLFDVDPASIPLDDDNPSNYLEQLVGDGKKYASPELLAKASVDKDTYIKKLEGENATYRETSSKVDAILEKLSVQPVSQPNPSSTNGDGNKGTVDVAALVREELIKVSSERSKEDNAKQALTKLAEHYGDVNRARLSIAKLTKSQETKSLYYELAATDPETFVTLVKAKIPLASDSTDPLAGKGDRHDSPTNQYITWSEAKKVLLSDKKKYYSKEYQQLINQSELYYRGKQVDYFKNT